MFTGLIQYLFGAYVIKETRELVLKANEEFCKLVKIGDSICINGVCLTVVNKHKNLIKFDLSEETMKKTTFGKDMYYALYNVELSLQYGDRMGGHFVYGHVNETGVVVGLNPLKIKCDITKVRDKGSIAINGVSLTAVIENDMVVIYLIPETLRKTNLSELQINDFVNVEYDSYTRVDTTVDYMLMALQESEKGITTTSPNPHVGCVLVCGNLIEKGYHKKPGENHAEIEAINAAVVAGWTFENFKNSTMYVTLEPCCHYGRTPPCVDAIVKYGIKKVFIGILDTDEKVAGKGMHYLSQHAEVYLVDDARVSYSLRSYIYQRKHPNSLPYVTLKIALTADSCYSGETQWITHAESRKYLYEIWKQQDAIIIGAKTLVTDNPRFMLSDFPGLVTDDELRCKIVVFDGIDLKPENVRQYYLFNNANTMLVTQTPSKWENILPYENLIIVEDIRSYDAVVVTLKKIGGLRVLVEGGGRLHKHFMNLNIGNELLIFRGSHIFGECGVKWDMPKKSVSLIETRSLGDNVLNSFERYLISHPNVLLDNKPLEYNNIDYAIECFKNGGMVVVMDSESRENEGDLIVQAGKITKTQMISMINDTSGIVCLPMSRSWAQHLNLSKIENNTDKNQTPFTISIDHKLVHTGISADDRLKTCHAVADLNSKPNDFTTPGHLFPLIARDDLLNERGGHTEASVTLCVLSGLDPVAVIGELKNMDGTIKNKQDCFDYAHQRKLPIISIEQLHKKWIETCGPTVLSKCVLHTKYGDWEFIIYSDSTKVLQTLIIPDEPFVRVHSECYTGDVLSSLHCDCGEQLHLSMKIVAENGGLVIFPPNQEGRGIGLVEKLKAYNLQANGISTYEANKILGHSPDARSYECAGRIIKKLKVDKIKLLTNNIEKLNELTRWVEITPVKLEIPANNYNFDYLQAKKNKNVFKDE